MHDGEVDIDVRLVEQLVAGQFSHLADLTIDPVTSTATVNAIFRLGDRLCVRLPRVAAWSRDLHRSGAGSPSSRHSCPCGFQSRLNWAVRRAATRSPGRSTAGSTARLTQMSPSTTKPWPPETSRDSSSSCAASIRSPMHPPPVGRHRPRPTRATRAALDAARGVIDSDAATVAWEQALRAPVWTGNAVVDPRRPAQAQHPARPRPAQRGHRLRWRGRRRSGNGRHRRLECLRPPRTIGLPRSPSTSMTAHGTGRAESPCCRRP